MTASVRENTAGLRSRLDERRGDPALPGLPGELFAAADVLSRESQLRAALSDAGQPTESRVALMRSLLADRVSATALEVLADAVSQRWSQPWELCEAVEILAMQAALLAAESRGNLEDVDRELFAFAQAVAGSASLQMALTDPAVGSQQKAGLVTSLLAGRGTEESAQLLGYAMSHLRGRRVDAVLDDLMALAGDQRDRSVAEVRVARPLEDDQATRLAAVLSRLNGRDVRLNVALDPEVIGGISVRIGNEVIDATVATRIEQARRALIG